MLIDPTVHSESVRSATPGAQTFGGSVVTKYTESTAFIVAFPIINPAAFGPEFTIISTVLVPT